MLETAADKFNSLVADFDTMVSNLQNSNANGLGESTMLGYNVQNIETLAEEVATSYNTLGEKMSSGWSELINTMDREWIGPDEVKFSAVLSSRIIQLYTYSEKVVTSVLNQIKLLGDKWVNFQETNTIDGYEDLDYTDFGRISAGVYVEPNKIKRIEIPDLTHYDMLSAVQVKNTGMEFTGNLGLLNGVQSANIIKTVFDQYLDDVYAGVKSLYTALNTKTAFLGTELNSALSTYLEVIGAELAQISTAYRKLYEKLDVLIANYGVKEQELTESVTNTTNYADVRNVNMMIKLESLRE